MLRVRTHWSRSHERGPIGQNIQIAVTYYEHIGNIVSVCVCVFRADTEQKHTNNHRTQPGTSNTNVKCMSVHAAQHGPFVPPTNRTVRDAGEEHSTGDGRGEGWGDIWEIMEMRVVHAAGCSASAMPKTKTFII